MEAVGEVVLAAIWGRCAKRETFLSEGVEEELVRLAVFWDRGGRGAPAGGALETDGRLFPPPPPLAATLTGVELSAFSPLGDVMPLSFPLKLEGLEPRRGGLAVLPPVCLEVEGAECTEVAESILESFAGDEESVDVCTYMVTVIDWKSVLFV